MHKCGHLLVCSSFLLFFALLGSCPNSERSCRTFLFCWSYFWSQKSSKERESSGWGHRCRGDKRWVTPRGMFARSSGNIMSLPFSCLSSLSCPYSDHHPHANSKADQNSVLKARSYLSLTSEFPVFHGSLGAEKLPESFGPALSIKASSPSSLENSYLWKACPTQLPVGSGGRGMPRFFRPTGSFLSLEARMPTSCLNS